jgi:hypothetical protein
MNWYYHDGGRKQAGYNRAKGDCVTRAIAIVTNISYINAYELVNKFCNQEKNQVSSAGAGVAKNTLNKILKNLGFTWIPKRFKWGEEQIEGKVILNLSAHVVPVIGENYYDVNPNELKKGTIVYGCWKY